MKNKNHRVRQVANIIKTKIGEINNIYRRGPSLHFYHRVRELRRQYPHVASFLASDMCVEILYATLVSWDMDSRRAKMKDFCDFKSNLLDNVAAFQVVETDLAEKNRKSAVQSLISLYSW